ncbi:carbohydrate sulfotransferase 8-like [Lingula anatina]|uniref:Carbohydrate sulfotransferase n=1 Tax=Lingula anatina TaxID=7574 RepID=A0A1S3JE78_LINAN|nr:carbohydrate sulfotransferase 8-like [Lingula anatina]|eukprot:XP_013408720.1 carbohydrate sulfotransferase 8-like [Lingula anatina]
MVLRWRLPSVLSICRLPVIIIGLLPCLVFLFLLYGTAKNLAFLSEEKIVPSLKTDCTTYAWDDVPKDWAQLIQSRRQTAEQTCVNDHPVRPSAKQQMFNRSIVTDFMFVDDRHGIIWCEIPKIGCTNWRRVLLALNGNVDKTIYNKIEGGRVHGPLRPFIPALKGFTDNGIEFRLKNYLKVIFVRHPFERLVSAFKSKLEGRNEYYSHGVGREIALKFEKEINLGALKTGLGISYDGYARYIVKKAKNEKVELDRHWRQYHKLCNPCDVNYDVIGHYSSIEEDANNVLRLVRADEDIQYPKSRQNTSSSIIWKEYYKNVSESLLQKLWDVYKVDSEMFGYEREI